VRRLREDDALLGSKMKQKFEQITEINDLIEYGKFGGTSSAGDLLFTDSEMQSV
jgi:hypothetical protein